MSEVLVPAGIDDVSMRALTEIIGERFAALPIERVLVWHVNSTQEDALPSVAELLGLNGPEFKGAGPPRELMNEGVDLRRRKGTPWALREVLRRLDYGEVELVEDTVLHYDGAVSYGGERRYGADAHWSVFLVFADVLAPLSLDAKRVLWDVINAWRRGVNRFVLGLRQAGQPTVMHFARP